MKMYKEFGGDSGRRGPVGKYKILLRANEYQHYELLDNKQFEKEVLSSDIETGNTAKKQTSVFIVVSRIILQAFTLTFLAEWGDRSQLATIVLAAREDVYGVTIGGILGHCICTGLAVVGGRFIAQKISVRTVTMIGGVVFLIFAVSALIFTPDWGS